MRMGRSWLVRQVQHKLFEKYQVGGFRVAQMVAQMIKFHREIVISWRFC